jgi:hypothetical protein
MRGSDERQWVTQVEEVKLDFLSRDVRARVNLTW